jgi:hypothetical protein
MVPAALGPLATSRFGNRGIWHVPTCFVRRSTTHGSECNIQSRTMLRPDCGVRDGYRGTHPDAWQASHSCGPDLGDLPDVGHISPSHRNGAPLRGRKGAAQKRRFVGTFRVVGGPKIIRLAVTPINSPRAAMTGSVTRQSSFSLVVRRVASLALAMTVSQDLADRVVRHLGLAPRAASWLR